jgi:hypothetical protein
MMCRMSGIIGMKTEDAILSGGDSIRRPLLFYITGMVAL